MVSQLKAFLRQFSPTTTKMVALLLATALDLVNTKDLKKLLSNNLPSVERQILLDAIVF